MIGRLRLRCQRRYSHTPAMAPADRMIQPTAQPRLGIGLQAAEVDSDAEKPGLVSDDAYGLGVGVVSVGVWLGRDTRVKDGSELPVNDGSELLVNAGCELPMAGGCELLAKDGCELPVNDGCELLVKDGCELLVEGG